MAIFDLFSKRQRRLKGDAPDVYKYDEIPQQLKIQIVHIIREAIQFHPYIPNELVGQKPIYTYIHNLLCKEYGAFTLTNDRTDEQKVINFFLAEKSTEKTLDIIEIFFQVIDINLRNNALYQWRDDLKCKLDEAISDLNIRFKEHCVGYQFESPEIIRIDSEFLHTEAVKPTLLLLRRNEYRGANEEFLNAHQHYRHGRHKECLVELLKAFESTMKTICIKRNWATQPTDTAKKLIDICFHNGLLPSYINSEFTSLRTLLESGIPTIRNKSGGHGQGSDIVSVPAYLARYAINLTASNILFMIEAESN